jgi:hypothetical protein
MTPQHGNEEHIMDKPGNFRAVLLLGFVLSAAGALIAQSTTDKVLVINGKSVGPIMRQIDGHSYVDVETLARVTNGVVTVEPTRIVLTIPGTEPVVVANAATAQTPPPPSGQPGLSRDFARAAIAELEEMRELRGAVTAMITYGLAASSAQAQDLHSQVEAGLGQATVAVSTDADRNAIQLLRGEYDKLTTWANGVFTDRQALNGAQTVDSNALQKDAALTDIKNCGQFLNSMIVSGVFTDNSSCH